MTAKTIAFVSTAHIHFAGFADAIAAPGSGMQIGPVWDEDPARGQRNAERFGAEWVPDFAALISRPDIDGFILCAPNNQRLAILEPLVAAGRPIMCEKPIGLGAAETRTVCALVERQGAVMTTGYFRQASGAFRAARESLQRGDIGRVTHARVRIAHNGAYRRIFDDPDVAWMTDDAQTGGGGAFDLGVHAMHLLAWFFGQATRVWASIGNRSGIYPQTDDHGVFQVEFVNSVAASAEAGWVNFGGADALEVFGDGGSINVVDRRDGSQIDVMLQAPVSPPFRVEVPADGPRGPARLLAAIRGQITPEERAEELLAAARASAMIEAAYVAQRSGAWQSVTPISGNE